MILQALTEYYENLTKSSTPNQQVPLFGWSQTLASFSVCIDLSGNLIALHPLFGDNPKKGRPVTVPLQLKRSGTKSPSYFLCDSAARVLGIDNGEVTEKSKAYFSNFVEFHRSILASIDSPNAKAIMAFLNQWDVDAAPSNPIVQEALSAGLGKGNLVFKVFETDMWATDDSDIKSAWNQYYMRTLSSGASGTCLITGQNAPIARIHNSVKGIYSSSLSPNGWTLVGFDKGSPAFSSFGKEQGYNAPVSEYAAFAYTTALNHLLADREHVYRIGDTTVLCWAKGGAAYQDFFGWALFGEEPASYDAKDLRDMTKKLCRGEAVDFDAQQLDPNMEFYVLGLAPNAARLSVRFFLRNSFGGFLNNVQAHYDRLEIVRPSFDKFETIPLWKLLDETVNQNARVKSPAPNLAGEVLRAVLNNTPYPATLLNGVTLRIRADRQVTRGRAAILKAYYLKHPHPAVPKKEVLTVSLKPDSTNDAYNLGRLFSVLEAIQAAANPGINATITDKFFSSASATPARVFPNLIDLSKKHLRKMEKNARIYYEKQLTELLGVLSEEFPTQLNQPQRGSFQLGYYHQTQDRYTKKEEK